MPPRNNETVYTPAPHSPADPHEETQCPNTGGAPSGDPPFMFFVSAACAAFPSSRMAMAFIIVVLLVARSHWH
jgi:hypothetical protein